MKIVNLTCPGCGARLDADADSKQATCEFCGAALPIDDEIPKVQLDGAEKAGYDFEKGRQKAQAEAQAEAEAATKAQVYSRDEVIQAAQVEKPKKRKTWLWVLGWIFIFPIPLTILMLNSPRTKNINSKARVAIVVIGWIVYLAIGFGAGAGGSGNSSSSVSNATSSSIAAVSTSSESASSQAAVEFDELQSYYLTIGESTTPDDLKTTAEKNGWAISSHDYTGSKTTVYSLGYDKDVAKDRYAKSGPRISVSFSDETGEWTSSEYTDDSVLIASVYNTKSGAGISDPTAYEGYGFGERDSNHNIHFDSVEDAMTAYVAKMSEQSAQ